MLPQIRLHDYTQYSNETRKMLSNNIVVVICVGTVGKKNVFHRRKTNGNIMSGSKYACTIS